MAKKDTKAEKKLDPRIEQIAKKLEKIRIEKGYTSYENFAIEHGITRMQYWRMEKGTNFTFQSLLKILDAHQMGLSEFFEDFEKGNEKKIYNL
ncbi:helix-turn-helix domain-containing protein [Polaribacter vadi]|uniref:helix-turn-helix domain-containing protein n=1 Tax=Polaribacter vadi TaxID=1774273 RepID=UPI0030EEA9CC|tara:strand:- start:12189 stop:12467 length:279 start_codon:yes stop_codon:yes gene_type:complete